MAEIVRFILSVSLGFSCTVSWRGNRVSMSVCVMCCQYGLLYGAEHPEMTKRRLCVRGIA